MHLLIPKVLLLLEYVLFIYFASLFLDGELVFDILDADGQLFLRIVVEWFVTVLLGMLAKAH